MKIQKTENSSGIGKRQRGFRNNMIAYAGIIVYIIGLMIRIPLTKAIGEKGIGLLAPALELFMLITLLFSYGISRTMTGLIRYRVKRKQFKCARKVFHVAFRLSVLISLALALILAVTSGFISDILVLESMSRNAILAVAPVIVLTALVNVFRGYFNGNGFGVLVAHSQYIEKITMLIATILGGRFMLDYGMKVAALKQKEMLAYAYGALGAILGIMISEIITLIYLLLVFAIYSGTWKRQLGEDSGRKMESSGEITSMLFGNGIPVACIVILSNIFMLIDQRFFNYCMNRREAGNIRAELWGSYYGKFAVLTGIGAALGCLAVHGSIGKIVNAYEREEYRVMRERIGSTVKKLCIIVLPLAINLAVLSEAFVKGICQGEDELVVGLVRRGTVLIIFSGFAYLFGQLMMKLRMTKELLLAIVISLAVHVLAVFGLVRKGLMGAEGIVYSVMIFMGILAILCFFFTARRLRYRQELLYSFALPAVSAGISGLVVMLLNKLLLHMAGNLLTILIGCLIGTILYIMLLMVLRVVNEGELAGIPFGGVWISIGRMIGVL